MRRAPAGRWCGRDRAAGHHRRRQPAVPRRRDRERPTAREAFLAACAEHDRRLVELQVTGPVTLAVALERAAGRRGQGTAIRELAGDIAALARACSPPRAEPAGSRPLASGSSPPSSAPRPSS
jgi:hypothetical protein